MTTRREQDFADLCVLEPRLWELYQEVCSFTHRPHDFCRSALFYGGDLWPRLQTLCGPGRASRAGDRRLHSQEALDTAEGFLVACLPECRGCRRGCRGKDS